MSAGHSLAPVAKWRQVYVDDIQPVVEVFAELLLFHHLSQIRVSRRQNTHIAL